MRAKMADAASATPRPIAKRDVPRVLEGYDEATAELDTLGGTADIVFNAHPDAAARAAGERCTVPAGGARQRRSRSTAASTTSSPGSICRARTRARNTGSRRTWRTSSRAGVDRDDATRAPSRRCATRSPARQQVRVEHQRGRDARSKLPPAALAGLPADYIAKHPAGADGKVTLTMQYPDYYPFMKFARSAAAREADVSRLLGARVPEERRGAVAAAAEALRAGARCSATRAGRRTRWRTR